MNKPLNQGVRHKANIRRENENKILAAAETVFAEKGFKGASVGVIAERTGVPKPNVYYYFGTKKDLYTRVLEEACTRWLDAGALFDQGVEPKLAFENYISSKMDLARSHPHGSRLFAIEMASGAPFLQDYLQNTGKPWLDEKEKTLQEWIKQGKIASVNIRYLFFMIWGTTQHYADFETQINVMNGGNSLSDEQFAEAKKTVIDIVLSYLKIPA